MGRGNMKVSVMIAGVATVCVLAGPAAATDYYLTSQYTKAEEGGKVDLFVESATIRTAASGYKIADITAVTTIGEVASVVTREIDCAAHSWRIIYQIDTRIDEMTVPHRGPPAEPDAFAPVTAGARSTLDFICNWPKNPARMKKIVGTNAVALVKKIGPSLKAVKYSDKGRLAASPK